jgi:hypothetical protein
MTATVTADPIIAAAIKDLPNAHVKTLPAAKPSSRKIAGGKRAATKAARERAAAREVAAQKKASQAKINNLAGKMTAAQRKTADENKQRVEAEGRPKPRGAGNGSGPTKRITAEWLSSKKKDVLVKDEVTTADGATLTIIGRWTRRAKDGSLTPMVTGRITAGAPDGKKRGDRLNAAAKDCTHVAKK